VPRHWLLASRRCQYLDTRSWCIVILHVDTRFLLLPASSIRRKPPTPCPSDVTFVMASFTYLPAQDTPRLQDEVEHRMRHECQSVQATYLVGQNCYWQLRYAFSIKLRRSTLTRADNKRTHYDRTSPGRLTKSEIIYCTHFVLIQMGVSFPTASHTKHISRLERTNRLLGSKIST
jgi:hypothetical protein